MTTTAKDARHKPARSITWLTPPTGEPKFGVARITVGNESSTYFIRELAADFGRGFEITKLLADKPGENPVYHVNLDAQTGHHSCECQGFLRWGQCKHVAGLVALLDADQHQADAVAPATRKGAA